MGRIVLTFNELHQVVTEIWTLNVVTRKTLTRILIKLELSLTVVNTLNAAPIGKGSEIFRNPA